MKLLSLLTLAFAVQAYAVPEIPKVTLATCELQKETVANWFNTWGDSKKEFESVVNPMIFELRHVNLVAQPGIADFYRVTIKGYDKSKKVVAQRELKQLAVNFDGDTYSVGYTPYDTDRTNVESFTMLIDGANQTGTLAFVPLQSSAESPFAQIEVPCKNVKKPDAPVKISAKEVLSLQPEGQLELLLNLHRIGHRGKRVGARGEDMKSAQQIGLSSQTVTRIKERLNKLLSERELPPLRETDGKREVVVTQGDRCGGIQIGGVVPIYDSVTYNSVKRGGQGARDSLGFLVLSAKCKGAARTITTWDEDGKKSENKDNWNVSSVLITTQDLISGNELKYSEVRLY